MNNIFHSNEYREVVRKNNFNTMEFLLKEGVDFAIVTFSDFIEFNPEIPTSIIEFDEYALFIIAGYSKESALLNQKEFSFEAGFGESNFGSHLTIPLDAIAQILVGEDVINVSHYEPQEESIPQETQNSMELLLNNPENQNLLKRVKNKNKD
jgi:hypothetical protein